MNARQFFAELKRRNVYKVAIAFMPCGKASRLFEVALVLVRLDHVTSVIVNADHRVV
jgi:hypothetical protein